MLLLRSPAKINWSLYVLNKREDGYHNILSLMQCINLFDEILFKPSNVVTVASNLDIQQEENLIYKAVMRLRSFFKIKIGVEIHVKKNIPIGAGLGGGSSNAAFTLMGLKQLWKLDIDSETLKKIGAELGSDVPFFFSCPMAIVEGRGDILKPLKIKRSQTLLLIKPPFSISTAWAYKNIRKKENFNKSEKIYKRNIEQIYSMLNINQIADLHKIIHNDFEDIAIKKYPIIADLKNRLIEKGALIALMSGSGSAIFGVFKDKNEALAASRSFSDLWCSVVETMTEE